MSELPWRPMQEIGQTTSDGGGAVAKRNHMYRFVILILRPLENLDQHHSMMRRHGASLIKN